MRAKIVSARGTSVREVELKDANWAGDKYRAAQQERIAKVPKGHVLLSGRGTRTRKIGDLPAPKPRPSTFGWTRITNRGTGSRKSKNTGSIN
ncbi:MAG: conserved hypothetical protein [Marine Group I thaumarchaeote]|nr:MAG: conserved hypothetical protein [Marine Group I thaumarchaeote]